MLLNDTFILLVLKAWEHILYCYKEYSPSGHVPEHQDLERSAMEAQLFLKYGVTRQ